MKEVWLRLGRTDAINWIVITVVATLQFVGSFVVTNANAVGKEILFVGCVAVSVVVVIALLLVTRYWLIPYIPVKVRPPVIIVMLQVTAFARAFIFNGLLVSFGLSQDGQLFSRIYGSQFNIFVAGIVVSSLVSMARDFSESNAKLSAALVDLRTAQEDLESRGKKRRLALVSSIRTQLETSLSALTGTNVSSDAQHLKSLIDDVVRPISHKLGREFDAERNTEPPSEASPISWSSVVKHALQSNPIQPLWLSVWTAFVSLQVIATAAGQNFLLPYLSAVVGFALWFIISKYVWAFAAKKINRISRAVLFSLLMLATPLVINSLLERVFGLDFFNARVVISGSIYFLVMSWSLALVVSVSDLLKRTNAELVIATNQLRRRLITNNVKARHFEQAVSHVLHGPIQDSIAASLKRIQSLPIDALPGSAEGEIIRHHVEDALLLLNESPLRHYSVERGVKELSDLWSGVVDIEVMCTKETFDLLEQVQTTSSIVIEVIREAVSNAIRHGDASLIYISLSVTKETSEVSISVSNNGALLDNQLTPGIGTKLLDDMTLSWAIENEAGAVVLNAVVPIQKS